MLRMISESIARKLIAFEEAEVPLKELEQAVGRDEGTIIISWGVVFQTPVQKRLSEGDARELVERYSKKLVGDYSKGQLERDLINNPEAVGRRLFKDRPYPQQPAIARQET